MTVATFMRLLFPQCGQNNSTVLPVTLTREGGGGGGYASPFYLLFNKLYTVDALNADPSIYWTVALGPERSKFKSIIPQITPRYNQGTLGWVPNMSEFRGSTVPVYYVIKDATDPYTVFT